MSQLIAARDAELAPDWTVETWFNQEGYPRLADFAGRVVVLHAFQMLCPGCVAHGLPQAQRIRTTFSPEDVAVIGLHSVFEHHEAMRPVSLAAFLHEYAVDFPVAVDAAVEKSPIPATMQTFGLRGTPSLIIIDQQGRLRLHAFGRPDDMFVGAAVAALVAGKGPKAAQDGPSDDRAAPASCHADGCEI